MANEFIQNKKDTENSGSFVMPVSDGVKKINTNTIEKALLMYKETVSPHKETLLSILNQIPEKENLEWRSQAIRSPYRWSPRFITVGIAALCLVVFNVFPSIQDNYTHRNDPFYAVDKQVESFEAGINEAESRDMLVNYDNMKAI